jgi:hypothetical protein
VLSAPLRSISSNITRPPRRDLRARLIAHGTPAPVWPVLLDRAVGHAAGGRLRMYPVRTASTDATAGTRRSVDLGDGTGLERSEHLRPQLDRRGLVLHDALPLDDTGGAGGLVELRIPPPDPPDGAAIIAG